MNVKTAVTATAAAAVVGVVVVVVVTVVVVGEVEVVVWPVACQSHVNSQLSYCDENDN